MSNSLIRNMLTILTDIRHFASDRMYLFIKDNHVDNQYINPKKDTDMYKGNYYPTEVSEFFDSEKNSIERFLLSEGKSVFLNYQFIPFL